MSDHSRRHTKPTSEEVYQDAKRILEEYLKRKLSEHSEHGENNNKKYARSESYKAASRENVVNDKASGDEKRGSFADEQPGVERSKTMPSSFRIDKPLHDNKHDKSKNKREKASKDNDSSPDTDAEHSDDEDMKKRKKKSFFKRAKERLMHALHRDSSRSDDEDVDIYNDHSKEREIKKKNKRKNKKLENGVHDSPDMNNRHVRETHAHIDQHISVGEDYRSKGGSLRIPGEGSSSLQDSRSGSISSSRRNSGGKKLLDSIRKSFRKSKKKDISESKSAEPVSLDDRDRSYSRSNSTPDRSGHLEPPSERNSSRSGSQTPESKAKGRVQTEGSNPRRSSKSKADVVVSQTRDHSAPRTIQVRGLHVDTETFSSVAPGPFVPPHFRGSIESSVDYDRTEGMTQADDGLWELSVTTHARERIRYLKQGSLEIDGQSEENAVEDDVDSPTDPPQDKEETIDRIVKKLIEIGDNLSSEGETRLSQESEGAVGGTPGRGDDLLSSLERELIECLRHSGDKASHTIDGHANDFINGAVRDARDSVYERFSTTLRQSVGDEVNWNQMALVFHATKGALKVAGAGTKVASQIKDLTLKYLTEKCASWIVDQGGWESIVSDTDSELD